MKIINVEGRTLPEAYHDALMYLYELGELVEAPDWHTTRLECKMTMVVDEPLAEPRISKLGIHDPHSLQKYCMEMLDGIMDFEVEAGNWPYTYHDRMKDQIDFIIDTLKNNPLSTRAVIDIRDKNIDMKIDDPACLQHIQFFIRDDKLDMHVLFRSNDALKATFMNAFALIELQKKIADELGLEVGKYVHTANSFHCYDKDQTTFDGYYHYIMTKMPDRLCYSYDDWKVWMLEEVPKIKEEVKALKQRTE